MNPKKSGIILGSLIKNGISLLVVRATLLASSMIITVFIVRFLGADGFGSYAAASNIYAVFLPIIFFGFGNIITRDVAKEPAMAWKYFINIVYAGFFITIFCTIGMCLFCAIVKYSAVITKAALILAIGLFPNFIVYIAEALFIGLEKVKYFAAINLSYSVFEMILILSALFLGHNIFAVVVVLVFMRYLFAAAAVFFIIRLVKVDGFRPNLKFIIKLAKISWIFSIAGILAGLLFKIDILFLSKMAGSHETGVYSVALKLVNLWSMALTSFIGVFYPIASKYYANNSSDEYKEMCQTMIKCTLVFVFLAIVSTLCLSKEIIPLLFGAEYEHSIEVFKILIFLLIPLCGTALFGLFLAVSNHQKYDLAAISIATVFSFVLNYYLVKYFSYYGSVYANLLTFFILQATQFYFVNRFIFKIEYMNSIVKPSVVLLITALLIYVSNGLAWYAKLPLVVLTYAALVAAFRLIGRKDIDIFMNA